MTTTRWNEDGIEFCPSREGGFYCRHLLGHTQNHWHDPFLGTHRTVRISLPVRVALYHLIPSESEDPTPGSVMRLLHALDRSRQRMDGSITIYLDSAYRDTLADTLDRIACSDDNEAATRRSARSALGRIYELES